MRTLTRPIQETDDGKGFKPIGFDFDNSFTGVYDGSYHLITNLFINRPNEYVGLFGFIKVGKNKLLEKLMCEIFNGFGYR